MQLHNKSVTSASLEYKIFAHSQV